jgi:3-oxoacyl-[acyl-carrier protein] reductase
MVGAEQLVATPTRLLLFGASGAIGQAVAAAALGRGWEVVGVVRNAAAGLDGRVQTLVVDPMAAEFRGSALAEAGPYDCVCWAQGRNATDSVYDVHMETHMDVYRANCAYILVTLQALLDGGMLAPASRMCVISSIWQNLARQSKLSYCMSKAALQGLVLSAAADLAKDGHLINAVLPGALDTPMTRRNLSGEQIERLSSATGFGRLPALEDVASVVCYLCSAENTGITGQFIAADLGFSHVRIV